jgi:hypothetical protein
MNELQSQELPLLPLLEPSVAAASASARQEVLITLSVLVDAPEESEATEVLDRLSDPLLQALEQVAAANPGIRPTHCVAFDYLDDPETNARRCEECGDWTTEAGLPGAINALPEGIQQGDEYLCYQCIDGRTLKAERS